MAFKDKTPSKEGHKEKEMFKSAFNPGGFKILFPQKATQNQKSIVPRLQINLIEQRALQVFEGSANDTEASKRLFYESNTRDTQAIYPRTARKNEEKKDSALTYTSKSFG